MVGEEGRDTDGDLWATCAGDCDDSDVSVNPGAGEVCGDGLDNDCNGFVDDKDVDSDGFLDSDCGGSDCDDLDSAVHPGAAEVCDGKDSDCDGVKRPGELDEDGDGNPYCAGDCDDTDPMIHGLDIDGDGTSACQGDCDDGDATIGPFAQEACDGIDNTCDGVLRPGDVDEDGDGVMSCAGDCDDTDPDVFPGNAETCDGKDNDCSWVTGELADRGGVLPHLWPAYRPHARLLGRRRCRGRRLPLGHVRRGDLG